MKWKKHTRFTWDAIWVGVGDSNIECILHPLVLLKGQTH